MYYLVCYKLGDKLAMDLVATSDTDYIHMSPELQYLTIHAADKNLIAGYSNVVSVHRYATEAEAKDAVKNFGRIVDT